MTIDDCEDANDTDKNFRVLKLRSFIKEFKKLRRQLHFREIPCRCLLNNVWKLPHLGLWRQLENKR